jgi:transcriptional regulator with XRE-family HTH domain
MKQEVWIFDFEGFSSALRQKRYVELRIDIREAALQIGVSISTLSRMENKKLPDLYTYFYCCQWLGVDMKKYLIKQTKTSKK